MTATDELRRMLDERGVEWHGDIATYWRDADAVESLFADNALDVSLYAVSPEQAIEATLGRGTCRNLIAHMQGQMPMLHCEECGCTTTLNVPSDGAGYIGETAMDWPLYCANCGRRVVAGDGE